MNESAQLWCLDKMAPTIQPCVVVFQGLRSHLCSLQLRCVATMRNICTFKMTCSMWSLESSFIQASKIAKCLLAGDIRAEVACSTSATIEAKQRGQACMVA
eukprot:54248-Pelagomonas_calceolata.AAC.3